MDISRTARRLQASLLPRKRPGASDQGLPNHLVNTAVNYRRSRKWKDLRGLSHSTNYGEKQMAQSLPYLHSDNRYRRAFRDCHRPYLYTMPSGEGLVGSRACSIGESDVLAISYKFRLSNI